MNSTSTREWASLLRRICRLTCVVLLAILNPVCASAQSMTVGGGNLYVGNENSYVEYEVPDVDGIEPVNLTEPLVLRGNVFVSKSAWNDPARLSVRSSLTSSIGYVGYSPNGEGLATVYGPAGSWTLSDVLHVGFAGRGWLRIEKGGVVYSTGAVIGLGYYGLGEATVTGLGSTWINAGDLEIGVDGGGKLYVADRAVLSSTGPVHLGTGWSNQSTRAALHVRSGARLITGGAFLFGDRSEAFVQGTNSVWIVNGLLDLGTQGRAYLFVESGGAVVSKGSRVERESRVYVSGAASRWEDTEVIEVGNVGAGSVLVEKGGRMSAGTLHLGANGSVRASQGGTITAAVRLDGGKLRLEGVSNAFGTLQVGVGATVSRLEFVGDGASAATFRESRRLPWGGYLRVEGYVAGRDSLRFIPDLFGLTAPLTSAQLARITFADYGVGAQMDADGYVTPIGL